MLMNESDCLLIKYRIYHLAIKTINQGKNKIYMPIYSLLRKNYIQTVKRKKTCKTLHEIKNIMIF